MRRVNPGKRKSKQASVPPSSPHTILLPDAGSLITLAYADSLDLLQKPGWSVQLVDMVLHEVTRNDTPTSEKIKQWVSNRALPILQTRIFSHYLAASKKPGADTKKSNLGELAIQECMNSFVFVDALTRGVFLFEDHKIARNSFLLPDNCRKITTRAFLLYLEQRGWLTAGRTAADMERTAILNGRKFSQLRFPPDWWL